MDEESWISGEELRTDGSSDEETTSNQNKQKCTPAKKRQMRKTAPKKHPPLTSSDTNAETKFTTSVKCVNKSKSMEESFHESNDVQKVWRPKRGSITLPVDKDCKPLDKKT